MHASRSHRSARICGHAHTDTCLCMYIYHMYTCKNVCTHTDAYLHTSTTISGVLRCRSEQSGRRRSEWCKNARRVITNAPCGAWPIPTAVCDPRGLDGIHDSIDTAGAILFCFCGAWHVEKGQENLREAFRMGKRKERMAVGCCRYQ